MLQTYKITNGFLKDDVILTHKTNKLEGFHGEQRRVSFNDRLWKTRVNSENKAHRKFHTLGCFNEVFHEGQQRDC